MSLSIKELEKELDEIKTDIGYHQNKLIGYRQKQKLIESFIAQLRKNQE